MYISTRLVIIIMIKTQIYTGTIIGRLEKVYNYHFKIFFNILEIMYPNKVFI